FNQLNIDGCTSTNDTVILLASGASGQQAEEEAFADALTAVCESLARQIARDGEETTKVIDLVVEGAPSDAAARSLGLEISDSDLVRSSFHGGDPNWGRILQAAGQSAVGLDPAQLRVSYDDTLVAEHGVAVAHDRADLVGRLTGDFTVVVGVGDGPGSARIVTTDLSPGYVTFNAEPS
ncbi:MAG: bifunctional ornithine acetyltransferase/N-acetylglutamate synthase, partial [Acidimicrobiia bacterium]